MDEIVSGMATTQRHHATKPVWLLDVDGVVNIVNPELADAWPDTTRFTSADGFPITWSPQMLKRIRAVHDAGLAEVRWLTTWEHLANDYLAEAFGLPRLMVAGYRPLVEKLAWWKLQFAREVYDAGHPVVWTDDDIRFDFPTRKWLRETDEDRMLVVSPRGGLVPVELDRIETWLTSLTATPDMPEPGQP